MEGPHRSPFTSDEEAAFRAIGHHDWYNWSIANWGTKWNASRVDIDDTPIEYGLIEITFETAWDAPVLVFEKMFEMFPALTFRCEWRHEDESAYPHALTSEGRVA